MVVVTRASTLGPRSALGAVILLHVLFMLGPPVVQTDIFGYLMYGRLGVLHDLVPYTHVANDVPYDPVRLNVGWKHFPSPYGPLFTLFTYVLAPLPVIVAIGVLKVGTAVASLGAVALTWSCARRLGRPALPAALFVGLNPLLLIWGVGAAHNDLFMLVLVLAGVRLALADRDALAGVAAVAAGAVKTTSGLVLPFMLIGAHRRGRLLAGALLAVALLAVASLVAFGVDGIRGMVATVIAQGRLVSGHSVPNDLFRAFGANRLPPGLRPIFPVIFAVVLALLLRRTWRGSDWVTNAGWATLALLMTLTFLMPWYVVWLLPLAALADTERLRWATLAFTAFLVAGRAIVLLT
ncbi:MAG: glycosyltransferase 87 family protein [Thermoleophilaceae bacterium]